MNFTPFEKKIGYRFKNKDYLTTALCHSSYANEHRLGHLGCNERLEFLGDSLLGMVTAEYLYNKFPQMPEGEMTKMRAGYVCESALSNYAAEISLGDFLLLGRGEEMGGGRTRPSTLSDAFEALLAAMYLDGGIEPVKTFLLPFIDRHDAADGGVDYKTALQEFIQRKPGDEVGYELTGETGPDHDKVFTVLVRLGGRTLGEGRGRSKKEAEQMAAMQALVDLQNRDA